MAKRMILMLAVTGAFVAALGFVKFKQIQVAVAQRAAFQPPPDAVTTIVGQQPAWPATPSAIGTMAAAQGVTVTADLPGTVDPIAVAALTISRQSALMAELSVRPYA